MSPATALESDIDARDLKAIPIPSAAERDTAPNRWRSARRALLREPLVHFLAAGTLLLALSTLVSGLPGRPTRQVTVSTAKLRQLRDTWTGQRGARPTAAQMQSLVDDYLREEIFFREAVVTGLDLNDTIIRRHLAQKVDFLAQGAAAAVKPTESEISKYFAEHAQQYQSPATVAFQHVYFSQGRRDSQVAEALKQLSKASSTRDPSSLGDAFMLQSEYPPQSRDQLRDLFGAEFAIRIFELPVGTWTGPLQSTYGLHLVRVRQLVPARVPSLDDVRDQVILDFNDQRSKAAADAYYAKVRARYTIKVEPLPSGPQ